MVVDLPSLLSIELGHFSLQGDEAAFSSYVKMKNLCSLKSLVSAGESFQYSRLAIFLGTPKLVTVRLPGSFQMLFYQKFANVSRSFPSLQSTRFYKESLNSFGTNIAILHIPDNTLNDVDYTVFDFSRYHRLEVLEIGNSCLTFVDKFRIDGLKHLKSLKIGENSFTRNKEGYGENSVRSFHLMNCDELELIEMGRFSFSDYGGLFELKNLPSLSSIKVGEIGRNSYNFYYSSFVIEDFPNLVSISLGDGTFQFSTATVINNLPNLTSIHLGSWALAGNSLVSSCSLVMKGDFAQ